MGYLKLLEINNGNIMDFIGAVIGLLAVFFWFYDKRQGRIAEKKHNEERLYIESQRVKQSTHANYVELMKMYNSYFLQLSLHPEDARIIYQKHIDNIKDVEQSDEIRTSVNFIIDTLKMAYMLHQDNNLEIEGSLWEGNFYYVFDPVRKPLFVSAYKKKREELVWLENDAVNRFVSFIDSVIEENQKRNEKLMDK